MITPLFRVRLDYRYPKNIGDGNADANSSRFEDELLALTKGAMHSELFTGNPACGPYLTAEYLGLAEAEAAEAELKAYLAEYNEISY